MREMHKTLLLTLMTLFTLTACGGGGGGGGGAPTLNAQNIQAIGTDDAGNPANLTVRDARTPRITVSQ